MFWKNYKVIAIYYLFLLLASTIRININNIIFMKKINAINCMECLFSFLRSFSLKVRDE